MGHTDIYIGPTNIVSLPETKKGNKLSSVENLFKWLYGSLELMIFFSNILKFDIFWDEKKYCSKIVDIKIYCMKNTLSLC